MPDWPRVWLYTVTALLVPGALPVALSRALIHLARSRQVVPAELVPIDLVPLLQT